MRVIEHNEPASCHYCLQLSLSYPRFLQIDLNRSFFLFYKIGSKEEFFLKYTQRGSFFYKI